MLSRFLRCANLVFICSVTQTANAQVVAEDTKLGSTPGLHIKAEKDYMKFELQTEPVEKDIITLSAEYTFDRWLLLGIKNTTGSVVFRGTESVASGNTTIFGKALLWRGSRRGGLDEVSFSVENNLTSPDSPVATVWGLVSLGSLEEQQLWIGSAKGSTRISLTLYSADGPLSTLLGVHVQLNGSKNNLKLGDTTSVDFGINRYLLPYGTSKWQIIGGLEMHLDLRESSSQYGFDIAETGGGGIMLSSTLRVVPWSNTTIFTAITLPLADSYRTKELVVKQNVKIGLSVSF